MVLTHENLINLMRFRPSLKATSDYFNTSEDTIERRIKKFEKLTFAEFKEKHSLKVKHKLIDKALEMAMAGNATMMIFCLKNYCKWTDKVEEEIKNEPRVIKLAYNCGTLVDTARREVKNI